MIFFGCVSSEKLKNCGSVKLKLRLIEKKTGQEIPVPFYEDFHFFFLDSMIICEQIALNVRTDENNNETKERVIKGYTFIDLPSKTYTTYKTFSDTSSYIKHYKQPDTGRVEGGWNFISTPDPDSVIGPPVDTVINGIAFCKYLCKKSSSNQEIFSFIFVKKKPTTIPLYFTFRHEFTRSLGSPVTRVENIVEKDSYNLSSEYVLLKNTLTKEELSVFTRWKKNLRKLQNSKP